MRFLSVCSGIEAASCAWEPLGWKAWGFGEIEPFPCAVLAHHYPTVPNLGDMTKFKDWPDATLDLLVGGTPCQSFSIAGLRKGLDDPRGNLMLTFGAIAAKYRPEWLVWENVPGVLSSNGGRDFGTFLGMLGQLGYGFAYRVLDAQFFGVPQRRRRVFVVGCLGDWRRAAAVLFERHSLSGNPAPRREAGKSVAGTFTARAKSGGWGQDPNLAAGGYMQPWPASVAPTLDAHYGDKQGLENQHINAGGGCSSLQTAKCLITKTRLDAETETLIPTFGGVFDDAIPINMQSAIKNGSKSPNGTGIGNPGDPANTLGAGDRHAVAFDLAQITSKVNRTRVDASLPASTLNAAGQMHVAQPMQVRRLTPMECERLQGFPDGYTDVPYRNKRAADGPRYKALGNSMAVPVMAWIGKRIALVNEILKHQEAA